MSSLGRATQILDALASTRRRLTVRDIEAMTGVPRSSVHRIIQELEGRQYVMATPAGGYRLGPGVVKIALSSHNQMVAPMRPTVAALSKAVNENVDLAILSSGDVVIVEQIAFPQQPHAVTRIGHTFSLHASCVGKALLSQLPDANARALLPPRLQAFSPNTITDPDVLMAEVATVRRTAIAFDNEEHDRGISAVATWLNHPGGVIQAIAIVAPTQRFARRRADFVTALLNLRRTAPETPVALSGPTFRFIK